MFSKIFSKPQIINLQHITKIQTRNFITLLFQLNPNHFMYPFKFLDYFFATENSNTVFTIKSPKNLIRILFTILRKTVIWSTIAFQLINYFCPEAFFYNEMLDKAIGIRQYSDKASGVGAFTNCFLEILTLYASKELFTTGMYPPLKLIKEFSSSLHLTVDRLQAKTLIAWYSNIYLTGLMYRKSVQLCLFCLLYPWIAFYSALFYQEKLISTLEVLLYNFFTLVGCHLGVTTLSFNTFFFIDLFFIVRIFKYRLQKASTQLKITPFFTGQTKKRVQQFACKYLDLHRQLQQFNVFTSTFYLYMDASVKLASAVVFAIFLSQSTETIKFKLANSQSSYVTQKVLHVIAILVPYLGLNVSMLYLAHFPTQNLKLYKLYYRKTLTFLTLNETSSKKLNVHNNAAKNMSSDDKTFKNNEILFFKMNSINFALKVDSMVAFLGSCNNKMAFSYASFFPITKLCTAENVIANLYLIILVYLHLENNVLAF